MQSESSVIANLAEIMQLEHDRVAGERRAEQAAREAVERARREEVERERREAERALQVQARLRVRAERREQRQARQREVALLRVRLDAEERARLQREALVQAEARAREEWVQPRRARGRWVQHASWLGALALIGGAASWQLHRSEAELAAVHTAERAAQASTAAAAEHGARLQAELDALRSASKPAPASVQDGARAADTRPVAASGTTAGRAGTRPPGSHARPGTAVSTGAAATREQPVPLGELEESDDDPLGDLFDSSPRRRKR